MQEKSKVMLLSLLTVCCQESKHKLQPGLADLHFISRELKGRGDSICFYLIGALLWPPSIDYPALQRKNTDILKQIIPEKEYRGLSHNFNIMCVCLWVIYEVC
jgi:hypothetical protein